MQLPTISAAAQALLVLGPFLLPQFWRLFRYFQTPTQSQYYHTAASHTSFYRLFRITVSITSFLINLIVAIAFPPPNLFLSLKLPLHVSPPVLTQHLVKRYIPSDFTKRPSNSIDLLPQDLQFLLTRLSTLDNRYLYVRIGHDALMNCDICESPIEFLLYFLPKVVGKYVLFLVGMGLILWDDGKHQWRGWVVFACLVIGVAEIWCRWDGGPFGIMVDSYAHIIRHFLFAIISVIAYFLPSTTSTSNPTISSLSSLQQASSSSAEPMQSPTTPTNTRINGMLTALLQQQQNILSRLRAVSLARISVLRDENFRERTTSFWETAETESKYANESLEIQSLRKKQSESTNVVTNRVNNDITTSSSTSSTTPFSSSLPQNQTHQTHSSNNESNILSKWIDSALEPLNTQ